MEMRLFSDIDLPEVTILLPVYREEVTLPYLLRSISQLDYPKGKLDIRIIVEPDDYPTLNCLFSLPQSTTENRIMQEEANFSMQIRIWEGMEVKIDYIRLNEKNSRAQPKSLNVGLKNAKGNLLLFMTQRTGLNPISQERWWRTFPRTQVSLVYKLVLDITTPNNQYLRSCSQQNICIIFTSSYPCFILGEKCSFQEGLVISFVLRHLDSLMAGTKRTLPKMPQS